MFCLVVRRRCLNKLNTFFFTGYNSLIQVFGVAAKSIASLLFRDVYLIPKDHLNAACFEMLRQVTRVVVPFVILEEAAAFANAGAALFVDEMYF